MVFGRRCTGRLELPTPQPTRRKQPALPAQRLLDYQQKKRKELLVVSNRVQCFLRQYRWKRMQSVWAEWMQAEAASPAQPQPMEA